VEARFSAPVQTGPGAHTASCIMDTGSFPGVKSGRGVTLTSHPLLLPWSRKGRAIPPLPLWAVRPVQSLSACTRVHFTITFGHESVELYLYSPYGLYGMYRVSVHVLGCILPLPCHTPPKLERVDDNRNMTDAVTLVAYQVPGSNLVRDTRCLHVGSYLFFSLRPSKFHYST
jgi:hypothetical protein